MIKKKEEEERRMTLRPDLSEKFTNAKIIKIEEKEKRRKEKKRAKMKPNSFFLTSNSKL